MIQSIPEVFSSFNHLPVYTGDVDLQLVDVHRICWTLVFGLRSCHDIVYIPLGRIYFDLENPRQFLRVALMRVGLSKQVEETYREERYESAALQVSCLGIRKFSPHLLEGTHLFASDFLGATCYLEDVVEALNDNTCKVVSLIA